MQEAKFDGSVYTVEICHHADGDIDVTVRDVGSSQRDRESIAWALREAAKMVEDGITIDHGSFC